MRHEGRARVGLLKAAHVGCRAGRATQRRGTRYILHHTYYTIHIQLHTRQYTFKHIETHGVRDLTMAEMPASVYLTFQYNDSDFSVEHPLAKSCRPTSSVCSNSNM